MLKLENNRLDVIPDAIGDLQSLTKLDISTNALRFLPASMGAFKKMQRIDCANNLLARVPPSMWHLKNLKEFNLRYNSLDDRCAACLECVISHKSSPSPSSRAACLCVGLLHPWI